MKIVEHITPVVLALLLIQIISCIETPVNLDGGSRSSSVFFRTYHHTRDHAANATGVKLFVFRTPEELGQFIDTLTTSFTLPLFPSFDDSMIVGIVYGEDASVSDSFMIDSVASESPGLRFFSHISRPAGRMGLGASHSHFVVLEQSSDSIILDPVVVNQEEPPTGSVSFRSFLKNHGVFSQKYSADPQLIVLRDSTKHAAFRDSLLLTTGFQFPDYSYQDSIIVGVITPGQFSSSVSFEIVGLVSGDPTARVRSHIFFPAAQWTDLVAHFHFVVVPDQLEMFELDPVRLYSQRYEGQ